MADAKSKEPKGRRPADGSGVRAGVEGNRVGELDATAPLGTSGVVQGSEVPPAKGGARSGAARTQGQGALDATQVLTASDSQTPEPRETELFDASASPSAVPEPRLRASATLRSRVPNVAGSVSAGAHALEPFGPYSRIEVLAHQGSIGLVARGYNDEFGRWELLKFLRDELRGNIELVRQFKREGRVLAQLSHPNVVQVFTTHEVSGRTCLAMEFLQGESLEEHANSGGPLAVERILELFLEAARGLAAAHEVGLLHRDLKPENLFVTRASKGRAGGLKLIDFGLATLDRARRDAIAENPALVSGTAGGTPLYMAPELWLGHEATTKTDLYALGLTFFFAIARRLPIRANTVAEVRAQVLSNKRFEPVREVRKDVPRALANVVDRLVAKDPEQRFATADELVAALVGVAALARPRKVPGAGPYRGLEPFTAAERDVFFGRDHEVAEVTERLRRQSGIVLVGPSGSGKSSLAHAGVVPAVVDGALGGGVLFESAALEPRGSPFAALAQALASAFGGDASELAARWRRDPHLLGQWVREALGEGRGLVLVVDQLEELATVARGGEEVGAFAVALGSLVEPLTPTVRVVATLRADLMDRLFTLEPLRGLLTRGFYPVRPLTGDRLRQALVEPARTAGYDLEDPAVADAIVEEVEHAAAGLPLMSFAMSVWWSARDEERKLLPLRTWRELGGVAGALVRHGDSVLEAMGPDERRSAEQILLKLVTAELTRASVARSQLVDLALSGAAGERALDRLLKTKLTVEHAGEIQLVHDALITEWPRLRQLLATAGEDRAFRERVVVAAEQWEAQNRAEGALWDGDQATRLLGWFDTTDIPLGQVELGFVDAVRRRAARRRFGWRVAVGFAAIALLVLGGGAYSSYRHLAAEFARSQEQAATAATTHAEREQRLLEELALRRVEHDPVRAMHAAIQARDLGKAPRLDPLAWRIHLAGVPRALPRHEGGATRVAVSRQGGQIVTAGRRGELHLVTANGPTVHLLKPRDDGAVSALLHEGKTVTWGTAEGRVWTVSTDGTSRLAVGRCRGIVWRLIRPSAGAPLRAICRHPRGERLVEFVTPGHDPRELIDAERLRYGTHEVLASTARALRILRFGDTGELDATEVPLERQPTALGAAGQSYLVGGADGRLGTVNLERDPPRVEWRSTPHVGAIRELSVSADGSRYITIDEGRRAVLWSERGQALGTLRTGGALVRWLPKRGMVAVVGVQLDLVLLDARTGTRLGSLAGFTGAITDVSVADDEEWLVATSADGGVRAWKLDEAAARVLPSEGSLCAPASDATGAACFDPSAKELVIVPGVADQRVKARRVLVPDSLLPAKSAPPQLVVGPHAKHLALVSAGRPLVYVEEGRVSAHDLVSDRAVLAFARAEPRLALGGVWNGKPMLRVLTGGKPGPSFEVKALPLALAFTRDGGSVAAGLESGQVVVYDAISGVREREVAVARVPLVGLGVSDDGQIAVSDNSGQVYAIAAGSQEAVPLHRFAHPVRCLGWAQEGRGLVAGTDGGRVVLLDVETGSGDGLTSIELFKMVGGVRGCARSSRDDRFLVASSTGSVWQRGLDLTPLFMARRPVDPLSRDAATVEKWRGLDPEVTGFDPEPL